MRKAILGLALAGAFLMPAPASAALVQYWDYTINSEWVVGSTVWEGSGVGTPTESPSVLSWGGSGDYTNPNESGTDARSALVISSNPATQDPPGLETNGDSQLTNVVTHYNNILAENTNSLEQAVLRTTLSLAPAGFPQGAPDALFFNVRFIETPNIQGECASPSETVCDDIFILDFEDFSSTFTLDGIDYTVHIFEATNPDRIHTLTDAQCLAAGAPLGCNGLTTPERAFTPVEFGIRITADVPEPTTMLLLGIGLLGAGVARRRRL